MHTLGRDRAKTTAKLVAERIITFAAIVSREQYHRRTDCGLGRHVHPQVAAPSRAPCATARRARV